MRKVTDLNGKEYRELIDIMDTAIMLSGNYSAIEEGFAAICLVMAERYDIDPQEIDDMWREQLSGE